MVPFGLGDLRGMPERFERCFFLHTNRLRRPHFSLGSDSIAAIRPFKSYKGARLILFAGFPAVHIVLGTLQDREGWLECGFGEEVCHGSQRI